MLVRSLSVSIPLVRFKSDPLVAFTFRAAKPRCARNVFKAASRAINSSRGSDLNLTTIPLNLDWNFESSDLSPRRHVRWVRDLTTTLPVSRAQLLAWKLFEITLIFFRGNFFSIKWYRLTRIEFPTVEIRRPYDCLISAAGFPIQELMPCRCS